MKIEADLKELIRRASFTEIEPNQSFHLTAAHVRFGTNPNGHSWAAASDRCG
jgi:hypothetical protein